MREYDALVVDASWIKAELSFILPEVKNVIWIPDGVNCDFFKPGDRSEAKAALIKFLEFSQGKIQPILGLILGQNREQNLWAGIHLAQQHPEWWIVVFDESFHPRLSYAPENLRFFGSQLYEDLRLLPMAFNGIDGLFFYATTGTPASWLMGAMACETPIILASRVPILELEEDFPRIDLSSHPPWEDQIPLREIEEKFTNLISKPELTSDFSMKSISALFPKLTSIKSNNELIILYTGNTQSYLEPCGCYQGQSGGIARRATLIERIRNKGMRKEERQNLGKIRILTSKAKTFLAWLSIQVTDLKGLALMIRNLLASTDKQRLMKISGK